MLRINVESLARVVVLALTATVASTLQAASEAARSADSFVDSMGINTHFGNAIYTGGNAYADRRLDAKLAALGIRHLRDHTWNDTGLSIIDDLHASYGLRTTLILGETTRSPAELVNLLKAHPAYEAIEGLNEPDFTTRSYNGLTDNRTANDYTATRAFQNDLYAAVKGDPQTAGVTVLSPAMGRSNRSQYLQPIQFDVAAMHSYAWASPATSANEPSYGLDTAISDMAALRGTKPLMATETGYYNEPAANSRAIPEEVAGKYMPRLFAEFFNRGVERTYLYELADQGPDKSLREQNFGLVRFDMSEKPAFAALKNLIDLLEEPQAPTFTPSSLDYSLTSTANLSKLHHTLLQKSNGSFYLLLWQEVLSYNSITKTNINVPPIPVTLSLQQPIGQAAAYLPNESATAVATFHNTSSISLNVTDQMLVLELSIAAPYSSADFDENGMVDGLDLNRWTAGFATGESTGHLQGDSDADADVDGQDFLTWQRQLDNSAAAIAVPEPATLVLICCALAAGAYSALRG